MNAILTVKCPRCGGKSQYVVANDNDSKLKININLEVPLCCACDEAECREHEDRRQEQIYGDGPVSFSFESFMEDDTVEHALYMQD